MIQYNLFMCDQAWWSCRRETASVYDLSVHKVFTENSQKQLISFLYSSRVSVDFVGHVQCTSCIVCMSMLGL
jgi:hypothetical protein